LIATEAFHLPVTLRHAVYAADMLSVIGEDRLMSQPPADVGLDLLVRGVGQVCISASMLEWSLTYLTGLIENWDDAKHRDVLGRPGEPLKRYRALVPRLEAFGLGRDADRLAGEAGRLLMERNRVVHSVMMIETKAANEPLYEAWHAKSDTKWPVDPVALNTLAHDLAQCVAEVSGFTHAWEERAERDGWPVLS
jgi:hypothetical protein